MMSRSLRPALCLSLFLLLLCGVGGAGAFSFFKGDSTYDEALKLWKDKQYEQSAQLLRKALRNDPDAEKVQKLLGWNYIKLGRLAEAETLFKAVQKEKPNDVGPIQGLAWINAERGRNEQATALFKRQAAWAKDHFNHVYWDLYLLEDRSYIRAIYSDAHYGLAGIAQRQGDDAGALKAMEVALKYDNEFTEKSELLTFLGDLHHDRKRYPEAIAAYGQAVKADPKALLPRLKMGWSQYAAGQYAAAEQTFTQALALKQVSADNLYGLALSQARQGRFDPARASLAKAIDLSPAYADTQTVRELIHQQPGWKGLWKTFGLAYARLGNYPAALYKLDGYLKTVEGRDEEALLAAGWSYRWIGSLDTALASFRAAAKLKPASEGPQIGIASAFLADGQLAAAEKAFGEALARNPSSAAAYNGLAYLYAAQKQDAKTEEALKKSLALQKDLYDAQAFLANLYLGQKRYAEAAAEYQKLAALNPEAAAPWNGLGWSLFHQNQTAKAIDAFKASLKRYPFGADAHYGLGMAYAKQDDMDEAKDAFATAIELAPAYAHTPALLALIKARSGWADLYTALGWGYYERQQYEPALNAFTESLKIKPRDRSAASGAAWSNYWLGRLDAAHVAFQNILKRDEENADALMGTGWILYQRNRDDEALAALTRATARNPELTGAWRTIAAIHLRKKNPREADAVYRKIAQLEPRALDVHNREAWALYREQKYPEAIERFNRSLSLSRHYGEPHYGLALCHLKLGEIDKARASFTTAIYLYPGYLDRGELYAILDGTPQLRELYNALGWSYYYQYAYDEAKTHFDRMLQADPANRDALLGRGTVAYARRDFQAAVADYTRLLPGLPATAKAWDPWSFMLENLGWSHYALKAYGQAAETFGRLAAYHPQAPYIAPLNGLGWSALQQGDRAGAERHFRASLQILPGNYSAEAGMKALRQ